MKLGAATVVATACLALPLALLHLVGGPRLRRLILIVSVMPLLTSVVVRSFAWIAILGRDGVIAQASVALGVTSTPLVLLQTEPGLILALTQIEMPLMLLPLLSTLGRLDPALLDASAVLGASLARTLRCVVLPAALPGLFAGATLVFASSSTAFISQSVIGGGRLVYLPSLLWQQAMVIFNWPQAAGDRAHADAVGPAGGDRAQRGRTATAWLSASSARRCWSASASAPPTCSLRACWGCWRCSPCSS